MNQQSITLHPDRHVQNGYTLAHLANGHPVFIHGGLPGESLECTIIQQNRHHSFALVQNVLERSPSRIESDCPIFPRCGGCSYRHISYEDELILKRQLMMELSEIGPRINKETKLISSSPDESRNHVQIQRINGTIGFFQIQSNDLVPLPDVGCRQINQELNRAVREYDYLGDGKFSFRYVDGKVLLPDVVKKGETVTERMELAGGEFFWNFPSSSFFQSNRFLISPWLDTIRSFIPPKKPATMELFCGSGIIGGSVHDLMGDYVGFESDDRSIKQARSSYKMRKWTGEFQTQDLYARPLKIHDKYHTAIIDPPRSGLNRLLQREIAGSKIQRIIYSSCNPSTLERDVKALRQQGNFRVSQEVIFDFFPRTRHLEMVLVLDR